MSYKAFADRDVVLSINTVEPELVEAVALLEKKLGRELQKYVLVDENVAMTKSFTPDKSGVFKKIVVDTSRDEEIQKAIRRFDGRVLLCFCRLEHDIPYLTRVVPYLPYCKLPTEQSLIWAKEKYAMRQRLIAHNPKLVPRFWSMDKDEMAKIDEIIAANVWPVIVKPNGLANSMLVSQCNDEGELRYILDRTLSMIGDIYSEHMGSGDPKIVVEEFMVGDMYSVDGYVDSMGNVSLLPLIKVRTGEMAGVKGYYTYDTEVPCDMPQSEVKLANVASTEAIYALQLRSTSVHIELFKTRKGWKIIELGARIGGHRHLLYKEAYGVHHFYNEMLVKLDEKPELPKKPISHAKGFLIFAEEEGFIKSVSGLDEAKQLDSMVWIQQYLKKGYRAYFSNNGGHSVIEGVMSNPDKEKLLADYTKLRKLIKIKLTPFDS